jgi:hypothetical protein
MAIHPGPGAAEFVPIGDPVPELDTDTTTGMWRGTGPDLLAIAAETLPSVIGAGPVLTVDLHAALFHAARLLGVGRDRWHRLRLADEAHDLFASYLVAGRHIEPAKRPTDTVRGWLARQDLLMVRLALAAASGHWRKELESPSMATPMWAS